MTSHVHCRAHVLPVPTSLDHTWSQVYWSNNTTSLGPGLWLNRKDCLVGRLSNVLQGCSRIRVTRRSQIGGDEGRHGTTWDNLDLMDWLTDFGSWKYTRLVLRSSSFSDRVPVIKLLWLISHPWGTRVSSFDILLWTTDKARVKENTGPLLSTSWRHNR